MRIYMDTSALVKLVVAEDESQALRSFLSERSEDTPFTAALARTELTRAVAPNGPTSHRGCSEPLERNSLWIGVSGDVLLTS